jgi:hypothetical protein
MLRCEAKSVRKENSRGTPRAPREFLHLGEALSDLFDLSFGYRLEFSIEYYIAK